MTNLAKFLVPLAFLTLSSGVTADDWKDESGKGKRQNHERREFKEEYWDGNCKVERKMEKNGEYKEERKCKPTQYSSQREHRKVAPVYGERVYYPVERVYESHEPAVSVEVIIRP